MADSNPETEAIEPFTVEQALAMRGTGWPGDLTEMRQSKVTDGESGT